MRSVRKPQLLLSAIGIIALLFFNGCVTQQQVKAIVAESNAAMLSPSVNIPEGAQGASWKDAVSKIDQLIASNPDQPVLVNHLKVRQAMLLTVNKENRLAEARWRQIDGSLLKTERDAALFNNNECLVWWYARASVPDPLDTPERQQTEACIEHLQDAIDALQSPDIRMYLGTIRAQMNLKHLTDSKIDTPERRQAAVKGLSDELERYVVLFPEADSQWVRTHWETDILPEGLTITDFRNASWLRQMIREFKHYAKERNLHEVVWKPGWIGELDTGT
jgi:hypothetical protein